MSSNNKKDFLQRDGDLTSITLLSKKVRVIVIGGGRAGFIKTESFLKKGCIVTTVAIDFLPDFELLKDYENFISVKREFRCEDIEDKHLIVIATGDISFNREIKNYCEKTHKLFLDTENFDEGMFIMPTQRNLKSINFSINTNLGSPKAALFLADMLEKKLHEYDDFIDYICKIRVNNKDHKQKREIFNFIASEDFKFFYDRGASKKVINLYFDGVREL